MLALACLTLSVCLLEKILPVAPMKIVATSLMGVEVGQRATGDDNQDGDWRTKVGSTAYDPMTARPMRFTIRLSRLNNPRVTLSDGR